MARSTKIVAPDAPSVMAVIAGARAGIPYTLDAMANDTAGLLDRLEIERAHFDAVARALKSAGIRFGVIGTVTEAASLKVRSSKSGYLMNEPVAELKKSWLGTLDW